MTLLAIHPPITSCNILVGRVSRLVSISLVISLRSQSANLNRDRLLREIKESACDSKIDHCSMRMISHRLARKTDDAMSVLAHTLMLDQSILVQTLLGLDISMLT